MFNKFRTVFLSIGWASFFLFLPFTSFPLISRLAGGTSVAPLALLPLLILIILGLIPEFIESRHIPIQSLPLFLFLIFTLISIALAYFKEIPSFRNIPIWRNAVEGLITLLIGIAFYLSISMLIDNQEEIKKLLKWLYIGSSVIFIFSFVQYGFWIIANDYPEWLFDLQRVLTSAGEVYKRRASGLAFEPSWLAHQLNLIYIPLWLGFSVKKFSIYKTRIFRIFTIENILLLLALVVLFISFSRIGWITTLLIFAFVLFTVTNNLLNENIRRLEDREHTNFSSRKRFFYKLIAWFLLTLLLALTTLLLGVILSKIDPRMEKLFDLTRYKKFGVLGWASQLMFAERLVYWMAGFNVYLGHPFFGTGLGGSGYFFTELVPNFGFRLPEIVRVSFFDTFIPNAKNLWVRLLAETGIIGFLCILSWLYVQWKSSSFLEEHKENELSVALGFVGKLFIIAFAIEAFSMDTFGLPYYWVSFGLIVALWRSIKKQDLNQQSQIKAEDVIEDINSSSADV